VFGFVDEDNRPSVAAFSAVMFEATKIERPHQRQEWELAPSGIFLPVHQDLAVTREADLPLPEDRDFVAYRPVLNQYRTKASRRGPGKPPRTPRRRNVRRSKRRRSK
jgi:hypothetical protein